MNPSDSRPTSDECGLLLSVLGATDDLTARLVYADWLDDHDDPRGPWLRAVCDGRDASALRGAIDPNWAALFDGRDHFTVLLTAEIADHLREAIPAGQPLRRLQSWTTAQSDFRAAKVMPGDHVYPIQLIDGRLHVLTRVRVAAITDRTEPFAEGEFLPSAARRFPHWRKPSDVQLLDAADGGLLDFDRALPATALARVRFRTRRGERGLSSVSLKDGKLTNVSTVHGVFRLANSSARDFAALVFAPTLLSALVPQSPPGKKRT